MSPKNIEDFYDKIKQMMKSSKDGHITFQTKSGAISMYNIEKKSNGYIIFGISFKQNVAFANDLIKFAMENASAEVKFFDEINENDDALKPEERIYGMELSMNIPNKEMKTFVLSAQEAKNKYVETNKKFSRIAYCDLTGGYVFQE